MMGDESCMTPASVAQELALGTLGIVLVKIARTGFYKTKKIIYLCQEAGIPCMPAITNNFQARREAVAGYLTKLIDGQPALIVSPEAKAIRKGFNGGYCFKRVQVSGDEKYRDMPDKNSYSHPHDALQYAALYTQTMKLSADFGKKIDYPKMGIV